MDSTMMEGGQTLAYSIGERQPLSSGRCYILMPTQDPQMMAQYADRFSDPNSADNGIYIFDAKFISMGKTIVLSNVEKLN